jgi:4-amino-4-deoxy-L-arabinose transferase-like glycosyltransferase
VPSRTGERWSAYYPVFLGVFTLVTRTLCRGPLYFGDGPAQVESIRAGTYIIQPPGYWLFNRTAGLFSDPVLAMLIMNILFSVAGVVVFYYAALLFTDVLNAFLAALAYSTVFYVWFSGEVHTTYASQLLFPIATFWLLLLYERDRKSWVLWLAALSFAVGAGMRPTDGVFLIPLVLYFAVFRMQRGEAAVLLVLTSTLCLGWLVPTWFAFERYGEGAQGFAGYVSYITKKQSVLTGVRMYTLANPVRYLLPLIVGFWPVLGVAVQNAIRNRNECRVKAMLIWMAPGSLFFVLILISDAMYLDFLTAAVLLLVISGGVQRPKLMCLTAVWNTFVFLALSPVPSRNLPVNVVNSFVLRTTRHAIQMRYTPKISDMQDMQNAH